MKERMRLDKMGRHVYSLSRLMKERMKTLIKTGKLWMTKQAYLQKSVTNVL